MRRTGAAFAAPWAMAVFLAGGLTVHAETEQAGEDATAPPPEPESHQDRMRALQEYRDTLYPDFIISADIVEDEPDAAEAEELEPTAPLVFDADEEDTLILEDDPELVEIPTLTGLGENLSAALEDLRMAILAGMDVEDVEQYRAAALAYLDALVDLVESEAPAHTPAMEHYRTHLDRLTGNLLQDYAEEDGRQLENTDRMIHQEFAALEQLLLRADEQIREDVYTPRLIPEDWVRPEVAEELQQFATRIGAWPAQRLTGEYRERLRMLDRSLAGQRRTFDDSLTGIADELYLIGAELSRREYEIHRVSRQSFVNSALRLEVLAEGLRDYLEEENLLYARRHVRIMGRALEQTQGFISLSQAGFEAVLD